MKIKLIVTGKTDLPYIAEGIKEYEKRLKHYVGFEMIVIPDIKNTRNLSEAQQKQKEGELILGFCNPADYIILLDERGGEFTSVSFSQFIEKQILSGQKYLVFIIGGPYGFSDELYRKAQMKISLSKMTFSHQMVRMIFVEQLYRAFTILKGEPYHHQ